MANEVQTQKQELQTDDGVERTRATRVYAPPVDIYTEDNTIILQADMPGMDENSLDITLEKDILTIRGNITPQWPSGYELVYAEYGEGDYQRSFTVPDEIDRENIEATVSNGVLTLVLPIAPQAQSRKISVRAT